MPNDLPQNKSDDPNLTDVARSPSYGDGEGGGNRVAAHNHAGSWHACTCLGWEQQIYRQDAL
jgi:hypothetical protein